MKLDDRSSAGRQQGMRQLGSKENRPQVRRHDSIHSSGVVSTRGFAICMAALFTRASKDFAFAWTRSNIDCMSSGREISDR